MCSITRRMCGGVMMAKLTFEEMRENEFLCDHCALPESQRGVRCYGGEPVFCIDSGECERAYANYLEEEEEDDA